MTRREALLESDRPETVLAAWGKLPEGVESGELGHVLVQALEGDPKAVHQYVDRSRQLVTALLRIAQEGRAEGIDEQLLQRLLFVGILDAPFSPWVERMGAELGAPLFWISRLRGSLPGLAPLTPPVRRRGRAGVMAIDEKTHRSFLAAAIAELQLAETETSPLAKLQERLALSFEELGALFGVSRQAATKWLRAGVPVARQGKFRDLLALVDLLERKLKRERIPAIVRQPARVYGGKSILEMVAAGRASEVLEATRRAFDWSSAA